LNIRRFGGSKQDSLEVRLVFEYTQLATRPGHAAIEERTQQPRNSDRSGAFGFVVFKTTTKVITGVGFFFVER